MPENLEKRDELKSKSGSKEFSPYTPKKMDFSSQEIDDKNDAEALLNQLDDKYINSKEKVEKESLTEDVAVYLAKETCDLLKQVYQYENIIDEYKKNKKKEFMNDYNDYQMQLKKGIINKKEFNAKVEEIMAISIIEVEFLKKMRDLMYKKQYQIVENSKKVMKFMLNETTVIKNEENKKMLTEFKKEMKKYEAHKIVREGKRKIEQFKQDILPEA